MYGISVQYMFPKNENQEIKVPRNKEMNEIRELFISFYPDTYSQHDQNVSPSLELFPLHKWDLYLRLLAAFRHGYLGIRYDDQHDLEKIQDRLDRIFCCLPPKTICCRLMSNGVVIYPHPMSFQIGSNNYPWPWSFERNGVRYADFSFKSQDWFGRRQRLMASLRKKNKKIPSLYHMILLSCTTREYKWFRFHIVP